MKDYIIIIEQLTRILFDYRFTVLFKVRINFCTT